MKNPIPETFDPERAVAAYRCVIAERDDQTTGPGWVQFNSVVQRLRRE
jgi:hypothetical protein